MLVNMSGGLGSGLRLVCLMLAPATVAGCGCDAVSCFSGFAVEIEGRDGEPLLISEFVVELDSGEQVTCDFPPVADPMPSAPTCLGNKGAAGGIQQFPPSDVTPEYTVLFTGTQEPHFISVVVRNSGQDVARFESGWLDYHVTEATRCHRECRAAGVTFSMPPTP
jgi:hypothetical protein